MGVYSPLTTSKANIGRREGYRWILIGVTVGDQFGKIGKLEGMMICVIIWCLYLMPVEYNNV